MHVPYVDVEKLEARSSQSELDIIQRIRDRRAPRPLQPLDLALLHSPAVADGWNTFIGVIRTKTSLRDDIREIAITRIAVKNRAWYEWVHHAPLARAAGVPDQGLQNLKAPDLPSIVEDSGLTKEQLAVAKFTDAMTVHVTVPDKIFDALRQYFNEQEIVELTATVSSHLYSEYLDDLC
jgi:alkylhydroperoxidase family enzyme